MRLLIHVGEYLTTELHPSPGDTLSTLDCSSLWWPLAWLPYLCILRLEL